MTIFRLSQESDAALSSWACSLRGIFTENVTKSVVFGRPTGRRLDFDMFSPGRERGNLGVTDNRAFYLPRMVAITPCANSSFSVYLTGMRVSFHLTSGLQFLKQTV